MVNKIVLLHLNINIYCFFILRLIGAVTFPDLIAVKCPYVSVHTFLISGTSDDIIWDFSDLFIKRRLVGFLHCYYEVGPFDYFWRHEQVMRCLTVNKLETGPWHLSWTIAFASLLGLRSWLAQHLHLWHLCFHFVRSLGRERSTQS